MSDWQKWISSTLFLCHKCKFNIGIASTIGHLGKTSRYLRQVDHKQLLKNAMKRSAWDRKLWERRYYVWEPREWLLHPGFWMSSRAFQKLPALWTLATYRFATTIVRNRYDNSLKLRLRLQRLEFPYSSGLSHTVLARCRLTAICQDGGAYLHKEGSFHRLICLQLDTSLV